METPQFNNFEKYKAGEVLRRLGIHRNTLGNYIKAGLIAPSPTKVRRRERLFLGRDLNKLAKMIM